MLFMSQQRRYQQIKDLVKFKMSTTKDVKHREIINGKIAGSVSHTEFQQSIVNNLSIVIYNYMRLNIKPRNYNVLVTPFYIRLDDKNILIPDISLIFERIKLDYEKESYNGAPDLVIEVVNTTKRHNGVKKIDLYKKHGVREYWIVDSDKQMTFVYLFKDVNAKSIVNVYNFSETIPVNIYSHRVTGLEINIKKLLNL